MEEQKNAQEIYNTRELDIEKVVHQACVNPVSVFQLMDGHSSVPADQKATVTGLSERIVLVFLQAIKKELLLKKSEGVELEEDLEKAVNGSELTDETKFEHELAHFVEAKKRGVDLEKCSFECYFVKGSAWGFDVVIEFKPPEDLDPLIIAEIALAPVSLSGTGGDSERAVVEIKRLMKDGSRTTETNELIRKYEEKVGKPFPN